MSTTTSIPVALALVVVPVVAWALAWRGFDNRGRRTDARIGRVRNELHYRRPSVIFATCLALLAAAAALFPLVLLAWVVAFEYQEPTVDAFSWGDYVWIDVVLTAVLMPIAFAFTRAARLVWRGQPGGRITLMVIGSVIAIIAAAVVGAVAATGDDVGPGLWFLGVGGLTAALGWILPTADEVVGSRPVGEAVEP